MPKGKKKGKYEHRRTEVQYSSDEDAGIDMTIDNCSEISGQSDLKSNQDDAENEQEKFEDKVLEIIDSLSARSNAARATALVSLRSALQRRYLAGLLSNHRVTLADHVTKMLRRGRDGEKKAAAGIAPLLAVQIGEEGVEEYMRDIRPALAATIVDKSASIEARCESCSALAALCYLFEEDITEILEIMKTYETIFSGSYLKGDGSVKVSGAAISEGSLHAHALDGWALLLTTVPTSHARCLLTSGAPGIDRLAQLTHATDLDVRMAAGCALAICHEHITDDEDDETFTPYIDEFLPHLQDLARDSHKYRAKKDRKVQRATFRDVLKYFEDGDVPSESVRLGREQVTVDSWGGRAAYAALAASLGGSLQCAAAQCGAVRAALRLPPAAAAPPPQAKLNKLQRHLQNTANCKARTLVRNKNRDKRSAALAL